MIIERYYRSMYREQQIQMGNGRVRFNLAIKRIFDVLVSAVLFIVLSPLLLVVSIAIRLDSPGPVIFKQNRMTKDGRSFTMYKFRSMFEGAEKRGTGLFSYEGDQRITRVGKIIRETSIDELPQLINIINGDLSIVGPRPPVVGSLGEYDSMAEEYKKRFKMRGGVTGLAQVHGRNSLSWDDKVKYDGEYIDLFHERGIIVDIQILLKTVFIVFSKQDVYEVPIEGMDYLDSSIKMDEDRIKNAQIDDE